MESEKWYARPVFSVASIQAALDHYCTLLSFKQEWKYEEAGQTIVTQVSKGEFEIILSSNLDRVGQARAFISLTAAELAILEDMIVRNNITSDRIHWGYPIIRITDPDGNELLFPLDE